MSSQSPCVHKRGGSRSMVRQVGDCLPIRTGKRLYIQLTSASVPSTPGMEVRYAATGERLAQDSDGLRALSYLKDPRRDDAKDPFHVDLITEDGLEEASFLEMEGVSFEEDSSGEGGDNHLTMEKISALEGELAKLKAQIAVYALAETRDLPIPAPPPPPPPPAPTTAPRSQIFSARRPSQSEASSTAETRPPVTPARPPMTDVLRDIGSVKLRTVHAVRSPGGTPLRKQNSETQEILDSDPASIIATALRKKFANRVFQDSPDKENHSEVSMSEFDSPNVKLQFN